MPGYTIKTNRLWQYAAATDAFSDAGQVLWGRKRHGACAKLWCFSRDFAAVVANMNSVVPWAVLLLLHVQWLRFVWCMCACTLKGQAPATQTWGFLGETAARLACVSYVIRRRRCCNWFVVAAGDGCCTVAGAAGQCLISYSATCRWKGAACAGTRAGCYARKLCCTRAHTWR